MTTPKPWTRFFLYFATLLPDLLYGWPVVLICAAAWGEALRWEDGVLRMRAKKNSWLHKQYQKHRFSATCLTPHAILYTHMELWPEERDKPRRTQKHEHVHVEQGEAGGLISTFYALIYFTVLLIVGEPLWAVVLLLLHWATSNVARIGANQLTALLRGEKGIRGYSGAYWGSHAEEAARAQEDD